MADPPFIFETIGPPAAGKLTIARQIVEQWPADHPRLMLLDNHYFSNPVLEVVGADGVTALPDAVWDYASRVRQAVLEAIETLSPPEWSFAFTNYLIDRQRSRDTLAGLAELARKRRSIFVPVQLTCDPAEIRRRAANTDRRERGKWTNPEAVERQAVTVPVLMPDHPNLLKLDTTSTPATESAAAILAHAERLHL